jgi:hypothetical protein
VKSVPDGYKLWHWPEFWECNERPVPHIYRAEGDFVKQKATRLDVLHDKHVQEDYHRRQQGYNVDYDEYMRDKWYFVLTPHADHIGAPERLMLRSTAFTLAVWLERKPNELKLARADVPPLVACHWCERSGSHLALSDYIVVWRCRYCGEFGVSGNKDLVDDIVDMYTEQKKKSTRGGL